MNWLKSGVGYKKSFSEPIFPEGCPPYIGGKRVSQYVIIVATLDVSDM